ncbi:hypothetical protein BCR33DRAFT_551974 [Rhizoclosmatium globosum]|uniref:WD40 repeat-like protein n=1 Tax=Rhizoclosmatium globosum TaxID=329046 RepID=A0A1Y2CSA3_9FUNG|nr:hypothetical protein BCR33DRAFT_551974 [Rhizoclosmatium globosum]|eukprot:ORY49776.1 hypothetical protein BCR33DRAFT_551974 [Rhizoclosmatium globosum]
MSLMTTTTKTKPMLNLMAKNLISVPFNNSRVSSYTKRRLPSSQKTLFRIETACPVSAMELSDPYSLAYVGLKDCVQIWDISQQTNPRQSGIISCPNSSAIRTIKLSSNGKQ